MVLNRFPFFFIGTLQMELNHDPVFGVLLWPGPPAPLPVMVMPSRGWDVPPAIGCVSAAQIKGPPGIQENSTLEINTVSTGGQIAYQLGNGAFCPAGEMVTALRIWVPWLPISIVHPDCWRCVMYRTGPYTCFARPTQAA